MSSRNSITENMESYVQIRNRRASDAVSGLELKREEWPDYSDDEIARQFEMFQQYDLDNSGFITPENMLEVMRAMDVVPDVSLEMVNSIIDEVAILTGHDNDGKLSFRDFMSCVRYDHQAAAHNLALDAAAERRLSQSEASPAMEAEVEPDSPSGHPGAQPEPLAASEPEPEPEAKPAERARRSSMSALNSLAAGRIKAFQQVATQAMEREKLAAFKTKPVEMSGPMVNSDDMHRETLRNKVKAFEVAATFKGKVELKKTWKKVQGAGNYAPGQKFMLGGAPVGVAPKKKISDLP